MQDLRNPEFSRHFQTRPRWVFSAPGRTELGGNHTDHQHGHVLAAAVDLDTRATVAKNGLGCIRVLSEGYPLCRVELNDLAQKPDEAGTTAALIRGVAARFAQLGTTLEGIDAYVTSTVLPGSGLSSSAAFEVLIGTILNHLFCGAKFTPVQVAQIGQWAENVYFGKPCGLMDQTASAVGGVVAIDFADPAAPQVRRVALDLHALGYALCILDTGADHAALTDQYAAIPAEMCAVAAVFGKQYLRDVDEAAFYENLPAVRRAAGDRAALRAMHFFDDDRRVTQQADALARGDFDEFLRLVKESGRSSWLYLQDVVPLGATRGQHMALALALAEKLLGGRGACRVHGGGFAGTIQAFVPLDALEHFRRGMEAVLGAGSCHILSVRPEGGVLLEEYA